MRVDSILIDEAKNFLIVSGPVSCETNQHHMADSFVRVLAQGWLYHRRAIKNNRPVWLWRLTKLRKLFQVDNLYDIENVVTHFIDNALRITISWFWISIM